MTTLEIFNLISEIQTACSQPATTGTSSAPRMAQFTQKSPTLPYWEKC
jgi:hypothetical protein